MEGRGLRASCAAHLRGLLGYPTSGARLVLSWSCGLRPSSGVRVRDPLCACATPSSASLVYLSAGTDSDICDAGRGQVPMADADIAAAGKRAAPEPAGVHVKTEPGTSALGAAAGAVAVKTEQGLDVTKAGVSKLKSQVRGALVKRQKLLADELSFLEAGHGLLEYCQAITKAGSSAQGSAGGDSVKKGDVLTAEEKDILAKAKEIELRQKQKTKWPEPPRRKVHHDYLLEEMTWLATDFRQERKWKMAVAKKVAHAVVKWHVQRQQRADRADKDKENQARKKAAKIAKEVKKFWSQIQTLAQHKQQVQVDVEKKKLLGKHLDFLVDQTEKYSTMIAQDLATPSVQVPPAVDRSETKIVRTPSRGGRGSGSGDGETMSDSPAQAFEAVDPTDGDFAGGEEEEDDEETMEEAEKLDNKEEVEAEVNELAKEQDMPLAELLAKYGMVAGERPDDEDEEDEDDDDEDEDDEDEDDEDGEDEEGKSKVESETSAMLEKEETTKDIKAEEKAKEGAEVTEKMAVEDEGKGATAGDEEATFSAEAKDVADSAAALKPTGHTLATTQVKTAVPFLLSPNLRCGSISILRWTG